ncbi:type VI secretion system ImpA family N-terminal domain-containing protein [Luteibacter sp. 22Crub2.1]|uniref:type VI secretion system ImpA family N-terminal domain-containing protein n=1 Tax=Luteibacter sp. 22Crub2.1 TaxID=1283288 RepID=UPI0009A602E7|nr:type VI secretion system ImpA family N-terminal domain-containing protein [Luteibacter sp. 22Crub2.1]SKB88233.1 type VI secretion system protein ImpA [Luteibacter sp. 22Crub2.1]
MPLTALTTPLSGTAPCGIDLSHLPEFDDIQEARRSDDASLDQGEWTRELKSADWPRVVRLCAASLSNRSKDLRVAGWYIEARAQVDGLTGMAEGYDVFATLCEELWSGLHPGGDEDDERLGCLRWVLSHTPRWIRGIAPESMAHELNEPANTILRAMDRLEAHIEAVAPADGPSVTAARDALLDMITAAVNAAPPATGPALTPAASSRNGGDSRDDEIRKSTARAAEATAQQESPSITFEHRDEALQCLRDVARFFRATEPHSPVAYLADKAAHWGDMALHEWLQQVLGEGDTLERMRSTLGVPGKQSAK